MRRRPFGTIVIGPYALLREGLIRILGEARFRIVASVTSINELTPALVQACDRVLLIIEAGNDCSKVPQQIALFKEKFPEGRVVVLGGHQRTAEMVAAFRAGANAYFDHEEAREAFIKALELVMLGETILPLELLSYVCLTHEQQVPSGTAHGAKLATEFPPTGGDQQPQLSLRESAILRCIVEGASNKVIARKIDITEATVKVHVKAILRKIRVRNRTQAAIWAMNQPSLWRAAGDHDVSKAGNGHDPLQNPLSLPPSAEPATTSELPARKDVTTIKVTSAM